MKKWLIYGDNVFSKYDGDKHYINPDELIRLYGLDPKECITVGLFDRREGLPFLPILTPRYDGDYREHLKNMINKHYPNKKH